LGALLWVFAQASRPFVVTLALGHLLLSSRKI